jgi:tetratricopeptide (TPR) repeat protein
VGKQPQDQGSDISRGRRWLFRLLAAVLAPLLFLGLCEGALRVAGYGHNPEPFVSAGDSGYCRANPDFTRIVFPFRKPPQPLPIKFRPRKPAATYRIFVLGGSAALGWPEPSLGFWRMLERMLGDACPGTTFQVVNVSAVAVNSHIVLPIARGAAARDPDLFVVYMGNNEVVGPFGPGTVFAGFSPSLRLIRLSLLVRRTKVGQLIRNILQRPPPEFQEEVARKTGMELFSDRRVPAHDPRMDVTYRHFRRNLEDIIAAGREAGAGVIVCTVATNLSDCAPFASTHDPHLTSGEEKAWQDAYRRGVELESAGEHRRAVEAYRAAAGIDDRWADLQFRLGRCLERLGDSERSYLHYVRARDLDALRFRADSHLNRIIREAATGREEEGVYLADVEAAFEEAEQTPHRLVGDQLLHEHVHLNFDGNYVAARTIFGEVMKALPAHVRCPADARPFSRQACAEQMVFTKLDQWYVAARNERLQARAPFTGQLDHEERLAAAEERVRSLAKYTRPPLLGQILARYRQAIRRRPGDAFLRYRFRKFAALRETPTDRPIP